MNERKFHILKQIKILLIILFVLGLWGGLIYRLYVLQIRNSSVLVEKAEKQQEGILKMEPRRGKILDRNNNLFAVSVKVKSLFCVPGEMENIRESAEYLASVLDLPVKQVMERCSRKAKFAWIKRKLSDEETTRIQEKPVKGIYMLDETKRLYPKGTLLSHVVGFVNIDNDGMEGLERSLNGYLKGKPGLSRILHDAKGRELVAERDIINQPEDGADIVLTVDEVIQNIVENEIERVYTEYNTKAVLAVVMNVKNGDILAIANRPTYDPNNISEYPVSSRKNACLINAYEPGSLFKVYTGASVLNEGVIDLDDVIYCEHGAYRIAGQTLHDSHPLDNLTFAQVIAQSSNIGFAKAVSRISAETFYDYIIRFGFGKPVGLPLEGEARGKVWHYKHWSGVSQFSMAMGHEIMVTILQLTRGLCTVANGGITVHPRLLDKLIDPHGNVIQEFKTEEGERVIREDTVKKLTKGLKMVVSEEGTAEKAAVEGYEVAGKTGTAQKIVDGRYSHSKYVSSFYGFLPADDPQIVITVMVDEPFKKAYGGAVAAPAFSAIAERVMSYMFPRALTEMPKPEEINPQKSPEGLASGVKTAPHAEVTHG